MNNTPNNENLNNNNDQQNPNLMQPNTNSINDNNNQPNIDSTPKPYTENPSCDIDDQPKENEQLTEKEKQNPKLVQPNPNSINDNNNQPNIDSTPKPYTENPSCDIDDQPKENEQLTEKEKQKKKEENKQIGFITPVENNNIDSNPQNNDQNKNLNNNVNENNIVDNKNENSFVSKKSKNSEQEFKNDNNELNNNRPSTIVQKRNPENNFSRYKICSRVGLKNLGNFSYLNSVLQCLNSIQKFANHNLKPTNMKFMEENVKKMPLSYTISRLFTHFYPDPQEENNKIYEAVAIKLVLEKFNNVFKSTKERNPITLLIYILNKLHEEYYESNPKNKNKMDVEEGVLDQYNEKSVINHGIQNYLNNNTYINQLFAWFELENLKCAQCGKTIYNFQSYFTLDLDILGSSQIENQNSNNNNNTITIYDCLNYYLKQKPKSLMCDHCHMITKKMSTKKIYSPPNYFIFTFNWYFEDENEQKKINNINLQIKSENIQLKQYILNNSNDYRIIGIVSYFEANKKFFAYYLSPVDNKWYFCDDEKVDEIKFNEILEKNDNTFENKPYIIFCEVL